uniref:Uncharacterized protein n=1 Tax=Ditylenchus dipsaci TaxID=166011 RepID=A0A915CX23_9BILA
MLAARGVSLGLGKINLSELNVLPSDRAFLGKLRRKKKAEEAKHKIIIKKHVDKQSVKEGEKVAPYSNPIFYALTWPQQKDSLGGLSDGSGRRCDHSCGPTDDSCRLFRQRLDHTVFFNTTLGTTMSIVDNSLRYKLKYAIYWSNPDGDKHAQIIQEESSEYRRKSKLSMSATATKTSCCRQQGNKRNCRHRLIRKMVRQWAKSPPSLGDMDALKSLNLRGNRSSAFYSCVSKLQ